ncbi:hypothetical protein WJX84_011504 [Apatococcus fuscideae]|uniref:Coiled-coil domain-containing protein 12 n=1 Tax=Apatococcus fuscideae TaxID=2026836 RepID=A0AAW1SZB9_9CHLO
METAAARKQRLNALKAQAGSAPVEADSQAAAEPQLKFRNYQPTSKKIDHKIVEPAAPPVYQEPVAAPEQTSGNGQDLLSIAPKKANWDLRRDVQPKLDKLERRTQRAMIQLMQQAERQQLEDQGGVADPEAAAQTA